MKRHAHEKDDNGRKVSAADDDDGELLMFVKLLGASCVFFFLSSGLVAGTSGRDGKRRVLLRNYYLLFVGRIQWARITYDDVGYLMLGFFCANDISF